MYRFHYNIRLAQYLYRRPSLYLDSRLAQRLQTGEHGNHIIAVYSNKDEKFNEAFAFLKEGLQRNEVVVLTTIDLPKDQIRDRIRKEWEVDVEELESRGDIIIRTTEELYFPDDIPNIQRTMALWSTLVANSLGKGKKGIRVFGDMTAFFRRGFTKELFEYELCLEPRFNFPAIGICAYDSKDIQNNMTSEKSQSDLDGRLLVSTSPIAQIETQGKPTAVVAPVRCCYAAGNIIPNVVPFV